MDRILETPHRNRPTAPFVAVLLLSSIALATSLRAQLTEVGSVQLAGLSGRLGSSAAAGDFDRDGFDDLASGAYEAVSNGVLAGGVAIWYGSPSGLSGSPQVFTQETTGVPGGSEDGDRFGLALVAGDLNDDGFDDLVIGAPDEAVGSTQSAGAITILIGSASGLTATGAFSITEDNLPNELCGSESAEFADRFGSSLAFARGADGHSRLLVGAEDETIVPVVQIDVGSIVSFVDLHDTSDRGSSCRRFQDDSIFPKCSGSDGAESNDEFGNAVAVRRRGSTTSPIAAADNEETASGVSDSGVVNTVDGCLQQDVALAGAEESGDLFGWALAVGDFDHDSRDDLAIGIMGEALGSVYHAGALAVVYADSSDHLSTSGSQFFTQTDLAGSSEESDEFGWALAAGDFDGDGDDDLAISSSGETVNGHSQAGLVSVAYSAGAAGLSATNAQGFDQSSPTDVPDVSETGDEFGEALTAGDFDGNGVDDLAIGVPGENSQVGVVDVLYGLRRSTGAFGTVALTKSTITVSESADFTFYTATRAGGAVLAASVDHERIGGTATPGVDFSSGDGTFSWGVGDLSNDSKVVKLVDDTTDEPNETIVIHLTNPSGGLALVSPSTVTITIVDDDPTGQLFVDGFETGSTSKWSASAP